MNNVFNDFFKFIFFEQFFSHILIFNQPTFLTLSPHRVDGILEGADQVHVRVRHIVLDVDVHEESGGPSRPVEVVPQDDVPVAGLKNSKNH